MALCHRKISEAIIFTGKSFAQTNIAINTTRAYYGLLDNSSIRKTQ
jgi:hypothetical protein